MCTHGAWVSALSLAASNAAWQWLHERDDLLSHAATAGMIWVILVIACWPRLLAAQCNKAVAFNQQQRPEARSSDPKQERANGGNDGNNVVPIHSFSNEAIHLVDDDKDCSIDAVSITNQPGEHLFAPGDMVLLGKAVTAEHRHRPAIITSVATSHCTVVVLDESRRYGVGECWPNFADIQLESEAWHLGSLVVVNGLQRGKSVRLNGLVGTITKHPRNGHPTFIHKPSKPDLAQLTLCVRFQDPEAAGQKSVLLEPKFLTPLQEFSHKAVHDHGHSGL